MVGYNEPINYNAAIPYNGEAAATDTSASRGGYPLRKKKRHSWLDEWKEKHALDASIEDTLRHTYATIHEAAEGDSELEKQVTKLMRPVAHVERGLPEPDQINYTLLANKTALLQKLLTIEQRLAEDEEAAIILLLGH